MTKKQEYKLRKAFGLILDSLNQSDEPKISTWLSVADELKLKADPKCIYAGFTRLIPDDIRLRLDIKAEEEFCVIYEEE